MRCDGILTTEDTGNTEDIDGLCVLGVLCVH
jgi:hypothetical protein